jgi:ABC-type multidrug transport system fused ATPase/permease subunit
MARIFEILDTKEQVPERANAKPFPVQKQNCAILFESVSFGYSPALTVLKDLSFEVEGGEVLGLVGPSGSGKTTLLNLIPRFYDPQGGSIKINGTEIREIELSALRKHIAYVFQEPFLLPGTISSNILYGNEKLGDAEVVAAAKLANAHEFISKLPDGYKTVVGEGSTRLSVGEKQRISIARAFLKNAPILLLDEPTSSLDAESEESIIQSLGELMKNRTVIISAHRFSTLRNVDRVMVIESGQVAEIGKPAELLGTNGYLARLSRLNRGEAAGHHFTSGA